MAERSGHHAWGPWVFDYTATDHEGLALLNGSFRGIQVFRKLSLPVIRVQYQDDDCGPYNDVIRWILQGWGGSRFLVRMPDHGYVKFEVTRDQWIEIAVYARIGAYHLYQNYLIHSEGYIFPKLYSKGLSCNTDHRHHPYWRFDINIDGGGNRISLDGPVKQRVYSMEGGDAIPDADHYWLTKNTRSGHGVFIVPGKTDTTRADDFSRYDCYIRKYRLSEDKEWWRKPEQEISFDKPNEPIDDHTDIVFWYIPHLEHSAIDGGIHWHPVGPTLQVALQQTAVAPNQLRRVVLNGTIRVVDYEHVGENEIETRILGPEFRDLSPDFRHGEFYAEVRVGGEVRVEFKITLEWNAGYVTVDYTALLFEGTSESTTDLDGIHSDIYVLNDNTSEHRTFMVKNAAEDSPDSARIEFRLENIQKP